MVRERRSLLRENLDKFYQHPFENADFQSVGARSAWAVTH